MLGTTVALSASPPAPTLAEMGKFSVARSLTLSR
jgi:hypothetical protein